MIISKLVSGLGNQLFQYTLARQLAIKNNDTLKLDIGFFEDQSLRSYRLNHYNIHAQIADVADNEKMLGMYTQKNISSSLLRKIENFLPKYYRRHYKEDEWWVYEPNVFRILGNVYLEGYWQHHKYFENIDPLIFKELTLKDVQNQSYVKFLSTLKTSACPVSIHVRRGDYITDVNAQKLMGVLTLDYYKKAINTMLDNNKESDFFVFSDDLNWVEDNLKIPGSVLFVDLDNGNRDYLELDIMSKCKNNIIANSSFSWWGAFLNQSDCKIVIAPKNWVNPTDINSKIKIQFPSWKLI